MCTKLVPVGMAILFLVGVYGWFVNLPMVKLDPRNDKPVACSWAANDWKEVAISDPACQNILKGRYETYN